MRSGIVAVLVVHMYITFSWWCWWYGGTFGQRPMIEIYPLLTLPLCAVIDRIWTTTTAVRVVSIGIGACLVLLNIFQTYQYELGLIHYDAMSRELYFKQLGKLRPVEGFHDLLDHPDYDKARKTGR